MAAAAAAAAAEQRLTGAGGVAAALPFGGADEQQYRVYPRRWRVLLWFSLLSCINAAMWLTFSPIITATKELMGDVTDEQVNWFSLVYMLVYVCLSPVGVYVLAFKNGMRLATLGTAVLTTAGAWIRVIDPASYWLALTGQTLAALGQVLFLGACSQLSSIWFAPSQRATATGICTMFNLGGSAVTFLLSPAIVTEESGPAVLGQMRNLLLVHAGWATFSLLTISFDFPNAPPTPPCSTSSTNIRLQKVQSMTASSPSPAPLDTAAAPCNSSISPYTALAASPSSSGLEIVATHSLTVATATGTPDGSAPSNYQSLREAMEMLKIRMFDLLLTAIGCTVGFSWALSTVLGILFEDRDLSSDQAGLCGFLTTMCGIGAQFLSGIILDRTMAFCKMASITIVCCAGSMLWLSFALEIESYPMLILTCCLCGIFTSAMLPICMEASAEIVYPKSEGASGTLLMMSCNAFGIAFTYIMTSVPNSWSLWSFAVTLMVIAVLFTIFFRPQLKRLQVRLEQQQQHRLTGHSKQAEMALVLPIVPLASTPITA